MMAISKNDFSKYIQAFQFRELLNEMGWNNDRISESIVIDNSAYTLTGIAEKSGFKVLVCKPPNGKNMPDAQHAKE